MVTPALTAAPSPAATDVNESVIVAGTAKDAASLYAAVLAAAKAAAAYAAGEARADTVEVGVGVSPFDTPDATLLAACATDEDAHMGAAAEPYHEEANVFPHADDNANGAYDPISVVTRVADAFATSQEASRSPTPASIVPSSSTSYSSAAKATEIPGISEAAATLYAVVRDAVETAIDAANDAHADDAKIAVVDALLSSARDAVECVRREVHATMRAHATAEVEGNTGVSETADMNAAYNGANDITDYNIDHRSASPSTPPPTFSATAVQLSDGFSATMVSSTVSAAVNATDIVNDGTVTSAHVDVNLDAVTGSAVDATSQTTTSSLVDVVTDAPDTAPNNAADESASIADGYVARSPDGRLFCVAASDEPIVAATAVEGAVLQQHVNASEITAANNNRDIVASSNAPPQSKAAHSPSPPPPTCEQKKKWRMVCCTDEDEASANDDKRAEGSATKARVQAADCSTYSDDDEQAPAVPTRADAPLLIGRSRNVNTTVGLCRILSDDEVIHYRRRIAEADALALTAENSCGQQRGTATGDAAVARARVAAKALANVDTLRQILRAHVQRESHRLQGQQPPRGGSGGSSGEAAASAAAAQDAALRMGGLTGDELFECQMRIAAAESIVSAAATGSDAHEQACVKAARAEAQRLRQMLRQQEQRRSQQQQQQQQHKVASVATHSETYALAHPAAATGSTASDDEQCAADIRRAVANSIGTRLDELRRAKESDEAAGIDPAERERAKEQAAKDEAMRAFVTAALQPQAPGPSWAAVFIGVPAAEISLAAVAKKRRQQDSKLPVVAAIGYESEAARAAEQQAMDFILPEAEGSTHPVATAWESNADPTRSNLKRACGLVGASDNEQTTPAPIRPEIVQKKVVYGARSTAKRNWDEFAGDGDRRTVPVPPLAKRPRVDAEEKKMSDEHAALMTKSRLGGMGHVARKRKLVCTGATVKRPGFTSIAVNMMNNVKAALLLPPRLHRPSPHMPLCTPHAEHDQQPRQPLSPVPDAVFTNEASRLSDIQQAVLAAPVAQGEDADNELGNGSVHGHDEAMPDDDNQAATNAADAGEDFDMERGCVDDLSDDFHDFGII
jgi:hypothetical protein